MGSMDEFTEAYIRALLWSSTDESDPEGGGGRPMDENYSESDFAPATLEAVERDCAAFQKANAKLLAKAYKVGRNNEGGKYTPANAGHDLALSRNGHGAGYFDRDLGTVGDKLQDAATELGEFQLYVGDDGKVYAFGHEQRANEASASGLKAQDFNTTEDALHHAAHNGFTHYTQVGRKVMVYGPTAEGRTLSARMYRHKGKVHFTEPVISKKPMPKRAKPIEHEHHEHDHGRHEHGAPAPDHKVVDTGTYRGVSYKVFQDFEVKDGYSLLIEGGHHNGGQGWHQDGFKSVEAAVAAAKSSIDAHPDHYGADDRTVPMHAGAPPTRVFPPGARVYVDGRNEAIIRQAFPKGSTSYQFPHYTVNMIGGDSNVAVSMNRVGVRRRTDADAPDPQTGANFYKFSAHVGPTDVRQVVAGLRSNSIDAHAGTEHVYGEIYGDSPDAVATYLESFYPRYRWRVQKSNASAPAHKTEFRWDIPLDEKNAGRWVEAQMFGTWLSCWYQAPAEGGGYWVQFDPESPFRRVDEIRELPKGSKMEAAERLTYKQKEKLPDSAFALPKTRDLPLTDKRGKLDPRHVGNAAARLSMMWHEKTVSRAEFEEASRRIERARKKLGLPPSRLAQDCIGIHTHHDMGGDLVNRYAPDSKTPPGVMGEPIGGVLSAADVAGLPVGSIVYPANAVGTDPLIVVPVPVGTLAPVSVLSERAGGPAPDGEPVAQWGDAFVLVSKGRGQLPTHGTAQRTAIAWNQNRRDVAGAPRRTAATYDFLRWMSGWSVTEEPGPDWLVAHRLSAVQGEQAGESILFLRQDPRLWHSFYRDGRTGSGTTPRAALDGSFGEHVRNEKIEAYCSKVTEAPSGLAEQYPALATSQRSCMGGEQSARRSERSWQMGEGEAHERGLVWLQRPDGVYWANATGGTFWLVPTPSGDYATTWMGTGGDQKDLGTHPYATAVQVAARFDPVRGQQRQAAVPAASAPLTKKGKHGTMHKYRIAYTDADDPGSPRMTWDTWAYNQEDAEQRFHDDGEGWKVESVARLKAVAEVVGESGRWIHVTTTSPRDAKLLVNQLLSMRGVTATRPHLESGDVTTNASREQILEALDELGITTASFSGMGAEAPHGPPFAEAGRPLPKVEYTLLVGPARAKDTLRIRQFLSRNGIPFQFFDTDQDEGDSIIRQFNLDIDELPAVVWKGKKYYKPANREIADILGFGTQVEGAQTYDVLIVGAGPSGLSCAVYAASEGLSCLVIEAYAPGGQAANSSRIENYAGFPRGISGADLASQTYLQAQKFGARFIIPTSADRLIKHGIGDFEIRLSDHSSVHGKSVVLSCGAEWRKPNYADLPKFEGAGVYYAATATEGSYVKGQDVIVVGGGNSAGQAAIFMSDLAHKVYLIVRGKGLSDTMSDYLIKRIVKIKNIELLTFTEIVSLQGTTHLEHVTWKTNGVERTEPVRHLFLMIGTLPKTGWLHPEGKSECAPSSGWLGNCVILDADKFIKTGADLVGPEWQHTRRQLAFETSMPGCFAVGDVRSGSVKRVATAVGDGAVVITSVHKALLEAANVKAAQ
jgi:thioredoxin reductase (NADPH)